MKIPAVLRVAFPCLDDILQLLSYPGHQNHSMKRRRCRLLANAPSCDARTPQALYQMRRVTKTTTRFFGRTTISVSGILLLMALGGGVVEVVESFAVSQQQQQQQLFVSRNKRRNSKALLHATHQQQQQQQQHKTGFYVHIPYCQQRCRYCNFAIVPVGKSNSRLNENINTDDTKQEDVDSTDDNPVRTNGFLELDRIYREALLEELEATVPLALASSSTNGSSNNSKPTLDTIYFGGGTPSLAPWTTIRTIVEAIRERFDWKDDEIEITMEMDPGTFDREQLQALKDHVGINRISLGVQTLDDDMLERLGRRHTVQDVHDAIALLADVFGTEHLRYSVDLITGLPGQTMAGWTETLWRITQGRLLSENSNHNYVGLVPPPTHLSVYDLQIEEGTPFGRWYRSEDRLPPKSNSSRRNGPAADLPTDAESAFMYQYTAGYLRHLGWEHYEISSYAKSTDHRSRHNQLYWAVQENDNNIDDDDESSSSSITSEWYAIGLGATSHVHGREVVRPRAMSDYLKWVQNLKNAGNDNDNDVNVHSSNSSNSDRDEQLLNTILKRLRTKEGLDLHWLEQAYGPEIRADVLRGASLGLELGLAKMEENTTLSLVDSKGFLYSNSIISSIFSELRSLD